MTAAQMKIVLLGASRIALDGLQRILGEHDFTVVAAGSNLAAVHDQVQRLEPFDETPLIVLVDGLSDARGPLTPQMLSSSFPDARLAILADAFNFEEMVDCFREGAFAYVVAVSSESLVGSLRLVAMGEKVMPSNLAEFLPSHPSVVPSASVNQSISKVGLSTREVEILSCLVAGHPNKIISRQLSISEATVKVHVKAILRKVGVQNRTQAAIWAVGERMAGALAKSSTCHKGDGHDAAAHA